MAIGTAQSVGMVGLRGFIVQMQAFISPGLPHFSIIGLPDTSVNEARERVRSACSASGFRWPETRVTVNLSPASLPKRGAAHDLAIAVSVLAAGRMIPTKDFDGMIALGELNLDGSVLPINGILPMLMHGARRGVRKAFVPAANMDEAELIPGIDIVGLHHLTELILQLGGTCELKTSSANTYAESSSSPLSNVSVTGPATLGNRDPATTSPAHRPGSGGVDMSQVSGQESAKWALTVAAAGGHHLIMTGPPGSGKTMLAERLPTILPPLGEVEQLEVASIRSLCGTLQQYGVTDIPPFEAPHHTASNASLVGGGGGLAQPGAITRAHHGVLFMDEAPEFSPRVLQSLREPLETGLVALARSQGTTVYPARFQLLMAANPCPCGFAYGTGERCTCASRERRRYWNRLSGPILDRIDIQTEVLDVPCLPADSGSEKDSSESIRATVIAAREQARLRYQEHGWRCNAEATGGWLREHSSPAVLARVDQALRTSLLSMRGADRALRLAWTLADLHGHDGPETEDIDLGIHLRTRLS
ncbi:YifB family Mg chelatase-like AAA ATPase [Bifidobacterium crudilactis]|jgi:magnesium chelatase family protein|uniref:YifB family Mg chelatase-like AAA ATPase n=1 Tax=Bifidobacterium crudilactis TaxID=327277 RepID=UPI000557E597|nr:YifB family Mg chelatase-like AAA ATPase [Bifidobacterium crudilactis]MCI2147992.1 YifB family Mg chelatase-like AAA ATPase [Bifidobacterium crudilactis]MCI2158422.1 YifB family Mg chelatase-like AAA ATPase [Bifidobacterium crudilactis]